MTPETAKTPKFAIGDVVQLKSGGPLMTVTKVFKNEVNTTWFPSDVQNVEGGFIIATIKLAE